MLQAHMRAPTAHRPVPAGLGAGIAASAKLRALPLAALKCRSETALPVANVPGEVVTRQKASTASPAALASLMQPSHGWSHAASPSVLAAHPGVLQLAAIAALALPFALAGPASALELSIPGLVGDSPLREGFVSGFLLILFSEIGDKTFFIALLLALKQSKAAVFTGTFGALAVMTVISVALGEVFHKVDELIPQGANKIPFDDIIAVALLVIFGVRTLQSAGEANESAAEEKEEAEEVVAGMGADSTTKLILSTFALVFAAEWGDKSFLATIALAAASSPLGVTAGAITGHGVATGIAVAGGSLLSKYVDERALQYVGGSLFLVFAAATALDIVRGV